VTLTPRMSSNSWHRLRHQKIYRAPDSRLLSKPTMPLRPHGLYPRIRQELAATKKQLGPWSGRIFRCVRPRFASQEDLLRGKGAYIAGGRWNPPELFRANYGSLSPGPPRKKHIGSSKPKDYQLREAVSQAADSLDRFPWLRPAVVYRPAATVCGDPMAPKQISERS
jgi:hypothetical protein